MALPKVGLEVLSQEVPVEGSVQKPNLRIKYCSVSYRTEKNSRFKKNAQQLHTLPQATPLRKVAVQLALLESGLFRTVPVYGTHEFQLPQDFIALFLISASAKKTYKHVHTEVFPFPFYTGRHSDR